MNRAVRLIALFEAFKGVLVLVAATGLLSLLHKDVVALATQLLEHVHLNPAAKYPQIFLDAASHLQDSRLLLLALGAAAYSTVRLVEAYGLLKERPWAEWLAAGSGGIYLPIEVFEFFHRPTALRAVVLVANALVVAIMVRALVKRREARLPTAA